MGPRFKSMDKNIEKNEADLAYKNSEAYRHHCEVLSLVRMYREHGAEKVKSFLLQVEKNRESDAAERLRLEAAAHLGLGKKR